MSGLSALSCRELHERGFRLGKVRSVMVYYGMLRLDCCHRSNNLGRWLFPKPENGQEVRA
jgi:hypothetical protein